MIQMQVDMSGIKRLQKDLQMIETNFPKLMEQIRRRMGTRTKQLAKQYIEPRYASTGQLKDSIIMRKEGADSTTIIAGAPYAGYVEMGTKRHTIVGNPYLAFRIDGRLVVTHQVDHPGARPMRYMQKAYEQIGNETEGIIGEELTKYFTKYGFR